MVTTEIVYDRIVDLSSPQWQDKPDSDGYWWTVLRINGVDEIAPVHVKTGPHGDGMLRVVPEVDIIAGDGVFYANDEYFPGPWLKAEVPELPMTGKDKS